VCSSLNICTAGSDNTLAIIAEVVAALLLYLARFSHTRSKQGPAGRKRRGR
jgi:hypothetical protein